MAVPHRDACSRGSFKPSNHTYDASNAKSYLPKQVLAVLASLASTSYEPDTQIFFNTEDLICVWKSGIFCDSSMPSDDNNIALRVMIMSTVDYLHR